MNKGILITLIITILIIGLLIWGSSSQKDTLILWEDTEVACLTYGHQRLSEHIHPIMHITVDGEKETIPANIGITSDCMAELHTHDETGTIHAESFLPGRISNFDLSHFFLVWNKEMNREGYSLEIIQDGQIKESINEVKLIDYSNIELKYTSLE